jgi:phosphoadenosine phosphosulfate reductase
MKQAQEIIRKAFSEYRPALAISGGGDSAVLLDVVFQMGFRPPLIFVDSGLEYPATIQHVQQIAQQYGLPLHIAVPKFTPEALWKKFGYPGLGKQSARIWTRNHKGAASLGFRLDCSSCCRHLKLAPGRKMTKAIKCNAQFVGTRGNQDDRLRGMRSKLDGAIKFVKGDNLTVIAPLDGWTDGMIKRYAENHKLPIHPLKARGLKTTGCTACLAGSQFENSGVRVLRQIDPPAWRKMIIEFGFGRVILAIRFDKHVDKIDAAIATLGGIEKLCDERPYVFDFTRETPLQGYSR